jgi:uncharacterized protein YegJ (DUF2314 family)
MPPVLEPSFGAYVKLLPAADDPKRLAVAWVSRRCGDPLRTMLTKFIESDLVIVRAMPKKDGLVPPVDMLRAMRMGQEEERRFEEATHFVLVEAHFPLRQPPLNVFGALAVANALSEAFDGVVIDLQLPRLLPIQSQRESFPANGRVVIVNHIVCPMSASDGGALWMTTSGMRRFGLPNFEMRHIPPNLQEVLVLMNSVAHRVLQEALARTGGDEPLTALALPAEIVVTQEDMVAAFGKGEPSAGQTAVRLTFDGKGRGTMEPFITIGPPASYQGELGEWYYTALGELMGKKPQRAPVYRPKGDDALERARLRAVREWPGVKERFSRGLSPQQKLFVKHGFPVDGGGSEFMWVAVVGLQNGQVLGMLANDSSHSDELRAGKRVSFAEDDIFDWMLIDGQRREGGYSIEALSA